MNIRTIEINDMIAISYFKDMRFYRLVDIAVWKVQKTVKTIVMEQVEIDYMLRSGKDRNNETNRLIHESVITLKDGERFMVGKEKSTIYEIKIIKAYRDPKFIGGVSFQKMVST